MSNAPFVIVLPSGERACYVPGSGLNGHAECATSAGAIYDVQIPDDLMPTWFWHGSVLQRVSGERLPTWTWPPPRCFVRACAIEQDYRAEEATKMEIETGAYQAAA